MTCCAQHIRSVASPPPALDKTWQFMKSNISRYILPNDAVGSDELELVVRGLEGSLARGVGSDVAEIAGVADLGGGGAVGQAVGVVVTTGGQAAVGVITKLAIFEQDLLVRIKGLG